MISKIIAFLKEVRLEVKKVNWPQRDQLFRYTMIVLGISAVAALFLGGLDFIFTTVRNNFIM